jgi:hypothetical protein
MIVGVLAGTGLAQTIEYNFETPYTNNITPDGQGPWVVAFITNGTYLTFTSNLQPGEFVSDIGLKIDDSIDVKTLTFSNTDKQGTFKTPFIKTGEDVFKVSNQKFDVWFSFETSNAFNGYYRFDNKDSVSYKVNPVVLISTEKIPMIAHIQGIDGNCYEQSTWLVPSPCVPESSSILLGGIGFLFLFRRKI